MRNLFKNCLSCFRKPATDSESTSLFKGRPRLPKFAVPKRYDVQLKPDLAASKFRGNVSIDVDIVDDTRLIVLNASHYSITPGSISFSHRNKVFKLSNIEMVQEDEILVLDFAKQLPKGMGVLTIGFEGDLNDNMKGFYRSTYQHNGENKNMAVTNSSQFMLGNASRVGMNLLLSYFSVPYPLPKLDMVAIPHFPVEGMENYGLVTFQDTALLHDEQHSAAANKQRVAKVVAHELAHQWFGNLVTMEWWTHLWLNEGFARWMSYLSVDTLFPEWKMRTQFLDESTAGLRFDGLAESHPIEVEINHSSKLKENFYATAIIYSKGASVLHMLHSHLGDECFQVDLRSLASYVKKHAYSNVKTEDLWAALEEASGVALNKLMNTWTKQEGYPVVSVKLKDQKLEFEQSQFFSSGSHGDGQWIIPLTYCCGSYGKKKSFLLRTKSETHDVKEFFSDDNERDIAHSWVKLNVDQTGFYRVKYDEELAARLRYAIKNKYLNAADGFGILDDSFELCMARQLPLASLLTLMGAYREELDYTVLSNLINITKKVGRIAADARPEVMDDINQFFVNLFQCSAEKLRWDAKQGETQLDATLRGEILTALAMLGHEETLTEASRRFHAFLNDRNTPLLPPDIRKVVDCEGRVLVAWTWFKEKWDLIEKTNGSESLITGFVSSRSIVSQFASFERVKEVEEFFATKTKSSIAKTLKRSLERVHINANWVDSIKKEQNLSEAVQELAHRKY
ncbi:hypothetical protein PTKIN_Ptkin03bG0211500 [Pterospermum kingtungense]